MRILSPIILCALTRCTVLPGESSALKLPLPDAAFDVVFCQEGLQFFPDRPAALRVRIRFPPAASQQRTVPAVGFDEDLVSSFSLGKLMAPHALDVPFVFDTLDAVGITGHSPAAPAIAAAESATWAGFARTGMPDNKAIPHWRAYTAAGRATMTIDTEWRLQNDPKHEVDQDRAGVSGRPLVDIEVATRRLAGPSLRDAANRGGDGLACEIAWLSTATQRPRIVQKSYL
jgi:hypothetical protein